MQGYLARILVESLDNVRLDEPMMAIPFSLCSKGLPSLSKIIPQSKMYALARILPLV
jgi:hypothetical protein